MTIQAFDLSIELLLYFSLVTILLCLLVSIRRLLDLNLFFAIDLLNFLLELLFFFHQLSFTCKSLLSSQSPLLLI